MKDVWWPQLVAVKSYAFQLAASFFVVLFMGFCSVPIHEMGHVLACQAFGVKVLEVEWGRIFREAHPDWCVNAFIDYAGGFFAAFCMVLVYLLVSRFLGWLSHRSTRGTSLLEDVSIIIKSSILVVCLGQLTIGIIEGAARDIYMWIDQTLTVTMGIVSVVVFYLAFLGIEIYRLTRYKKGEG